jgi:hypothetical protein
MTESAFAMSESDETFDVLDPKHNAPIVVALASDEAASITGQTFFVFGGAVNCLEPWSGGTQFVREEGWEPDGLLAELLTRFPEGRAPVSMAERLAEAGGTSLQSN